MHAHFSGYISFQSSKQLERHTSTSPDNRDIRGLAQTKRRNDSDPICEEGQSQLLKFMMHVRESKITSWSNHTRFSKRENVLKKKNTKPGSPCAGKQPKYQNHEAEPRHF